MSEELEIHPSHLPESDGKKLYYGGKACMKCLSFLQFDGLGWITDKATKPCVGPIKVSLR